LTTGGGSFTPGKFFSPLGFLFSSFRGASFSTFGGSATGLNSGDWSVNTNAAASEFSELSSLSDGAGVPPSVKVGQLAPRLFNLSLGSRGGLGVSVFTDLLSFSFSTSGGPGEVSPRDAVWGFPLSAETFSPALEDPLLLSSLLSTFSWIPTTPAIEPDFFALRGRELPDFSELWDEWRDWDPYGTGEPSAWETLIREVFDRPDLEDSEFFELISEYHTQGETCVDTSGEVEVDTSGKLDPEVVEAVFRLLRDYSDTPDTQSPRAAGSWTLVSPRPF
jgi:hypothetical protein